MTPICCCPENPTKQIENCRIFTFKDPSLKEATLATIIDQFQQDFSSKMATFIESKSHFCKSCAGESDSLIFLSPIRTMKIGMSILDTFHERKLKQLSQRLQYILLNRFFLQQTRTTFNDEKNLLNEFYVELHKKETQEKRSFFQNLETNSQRIESRRINRDKSMNFNALSMKKRRFYKFRRKKPIRCHFRLISSLKNENFSQSHRTIDEILDENWKNRSSRINFDDEFLSCDTSDFVSSSNHAIDDLEVISKKSKSHRTISTKINKRFISKDIMSGDEKFVFDNALKDVRRQNLSTRFAFRGRTSRQTFTFVEKDRCDIEFSTEIIYFTRRFVTTTKFSFTKIFVN